MEASVIVVFLLFVLSATVFWIWALADVIRRCPETLQRGSVLLWALVIALTHAVGAAVYVLAGRPRRAGIASVAR